MDKKQKIELLRNIERGRTNINDLQEPTSIDLTQLTVEELEFLRMMNTKYKDLFDASKSKRISIADLEDADARKYYTILTKYKHQ